MSDRFSVVCRVHPLRYLGFGVKMCVFLATESKELYKRGALMETRTIT